MNTQRISRIAILLRHDRRCWRSSGSCCLGVPFPAASTPQGRFEKTFQVSGPVDLEVQTHSGDIIVRSGPAGSVSIRGKIYVGDHWLFGGRHAEREPTLNSILPCGRMGTASTSIT